MAHYTLIHGYLKSLRQYVDRNQAIMDEFEFDEIYPFANQFGRFSASTVSDWFVISYSTIMKHDDEDTWLEWISRFEQLLERMDGYLTQVRFQSDREGVIYVRGYSALGDDREIWENWVREPITHPAVAGVINFMDDEEAPEVSSEEIS